MHGAAARSGTDFDRARIHFEWNKVAQTGRAETFVARLNQLGRPIVMTWGFRLCFLYIVAALKEAGVQTWWFNADDAVAREAFVARGGIDVQNFEIQMTDIGREWILLRSVFHPRVIETLSSSGRLTFEQIWERVAAAV